MTKKDKKVNPKDILKTTIKNAIKDSLSSYGEILDGKDFGFTKDTLVARTAEYDVQIKIITPKTGELRYKTEEESEE